MNKLTYDCPEEVDKKLEPEDGDLLNCPWVFYIKLCGAVGNYISTRKDANE